MQFLVQMPTAVMSVNASADCLNLSKNIKGTLTSKEQPSVTDLHGGLPEYNNP